MNIGHINHVNLIGQISSELFRFTNSKGEDYLNFSVKTQETVLKENGETKHISNWHQINATGKWVHLLSELGEKGVALALEGKLVSRFSRSKGRLIKHTAVEVNDLVIL
jgi:single-strand DNA-binding protein